MDLCLTIWKWYSKLNCSTLEPRNSLSGDLDKILSTSHVFPPLSLALNLIRMNWYIEIFMKYSYIYVILSSIKKICNYNLMSLMKPCRGHEVWQIYQVFQFQIYLFYLHKRNNFEYLISMAYLCLDFNIFLSLYLVFCFKSQILLEIIKIIILFCKDFLSVCIWVS